jgi:hypothetical protein
MAAEKIIVKPVFSKETAYTGSSFRIDPRAWHSYVGAKPTSQ